MKEITKEQALKLADEKFWEGMTHEERARFQLYTDRLCMPFGVFHEAMEKALGRSVFTHEFARADLLKAEMEGDRQAPSFDEILGLIPEEKRIVVVGGAS